MDTHKPSLHILLEGLRSRGRVVVGRASRGRASSVGIVDVVFVLVAGHHFQIKSSIDYLAWGNKQAKLLICELDREVKRQMWNRLMNRLARLGFLLFLALHRSDAVPHTDHHHQHHHHHNNHSLEHSLFTKHIAPITKSSPPSPNSHRAMYQWNDTSNSFHQTYIKLPADAPFLKNEQFFNTYKHVSSINETVDHTQCQWPILMEIFAGRTNCFFVDLASNHWETGSNTVGLEEFFNWKGICVEPTALYWEGILSNRKCTLVASPVYYENNVQVTFHVNEGLGGIVAAGTDNEGAKENNVVLPTVTLNSIIDTLAPASVIRKAPPMGGTATHRRVIDYFSLDIEGAEYDAMKNFDFDHTVFLVLTIERPKELLHELLVKNGYWFLRNVWRTSPFGEAVYLHYTCPRFVELMTKHRKNPNIRYSNVNVHYNPVYLLRPAWLPMEALVDNLSTITTTMGRDDRIRHQQSVYKLFETFRSTFTSLMMDGDVFKCHRNARQLYYFRGGRAHPIPSMHVFAKLDQGRRDIDEVFVMSPSYCEHLSMGNALDATTATLPPNDPFWSAAAAAAGVAAVV